MNFNNDLNEEETTKSNNDNSLGAPNQENEIDSNVEDRDDYANVLSAHLLENKGSIINSNSRHEALTNRRL